ncbi:MAG: GNAT family N-acetyltransferase [Bradymonadales bacterium]|nr:GNAT family N-acetyltransferase [Bradymonadales bacterium]
MVTIEFRDFDGDLEALRAMASDSWFSEYGIQTWPDLYKPDLARHYFAEVSDPRYLVGAYDGDRLVAFVANLPRTYRLKGKTYQAAQSCMLVGHKDYRRRHLALDLIAECLRRNQEIGIDLALLTLERKHASALMFQKHLTGQHHIERVKRMAPVARPIDMEVLVRAEKLKWYESMVMRCLGAHRPMVLPDVPGTIRPYTASDLGSILAMLRRYPDDDCLVRVFNEESLARQLDQKNVTYTVVYEKGGETVGFINFSLLDLVNNAGRYRWAWVDFLAWAGLTWKEKKALIAGLWQNARDLGCVSIMEWTKGYYSIGPLLRSHFVTYPRYLDLMAWIFNPDLSLRGVEKILDQQI